MPAEGLCAGKEVMQPPWQGVPTARGYPQPPAPHLLRKRPRGRGDV